MYVVKAFACLSASMHFSTSLRVSSSSAVVLPPAAMKRVKQESVDDHAPAASDNDATQLAAAAAAGLPAVAKTVNIREASVCYPCGLGSEIQKYRRCVRCDNKRATVLMLASPELWPSTRTATLCYKCNCNFDGAGSGVYVITQSALPWGNCPVCCECYGVDTPARHLQKQ